jgi:anaerobic selenocysteine-containing dehydrogenase
MTKKKLPSLCPMDCPDTCSLEVEVEDGRVTAIRGTEVNPTTAGFICSKVADFPKRLYGPDRLLHPMRRIGPKGSGQFSRISWEQAVATICKKFHTIREQFGGEAILPYSYGGSNGILGQDTSDKAFFAKLGASRLDRTVCAVPTTVAAKGMYGKMPGVAFEDYVHAKMIIIWGANPKASNIHLVPFLKEAKANGAFIAVVDPRQNFSDREIDLHLPVYPGTDLVVALAMINFWSQNNLLDKAFLEKYATGLDILLEKASAYSLDRAAALSHLPSAGIEKLATIYAESKPAVIRVGWGPERNKNGGNAIAAILAMPALLGKFGMRGGGYTLSNSTAAKLDSEKLVEAAPWNTRIVNMNLLGKYLLEENEPPIKALFVYNCNPAVTVPNQHLILRGLQREDLFTVVFDQVMTDTAKYADILLPAVTFLEQQEIKKSYGSYVLGYCDPAIAPVGESKPNEEVFAMLGRGMSWDDKAFHETTEDYLRRAAGAIKGLGKPITLEELRAKRVLPFDFPGPHPVQFKHFTAWTPTGKINLAPQGLSYEFQENGFDKKYPLALISPATDKMISSMLGEYNFPELYVVMHPNDALARRLVNGVSVRVYNDYGEVHCRLRINPEICEGVVGMPKGAWRKSSLNGFTATALAPDTLGTAGGACFNDARVEVSRP